MARTGSKDSSLAPDSRSATPAPESRPETPEPATLVEVKTAEKASVPEGVPGDWEADSEEEAPTTPAIKGVKEDWDDSSEDENATSGGKGAKPSTPVKTVAKPPPRKAEAPKQSADTKGRFL